MHSDLWLKTPLIKSTYISTSLNCRAYLKLDNLQPAHSFKNRGISLFVQECKVKYGPSVHIIIASGGNAGLAAAYAANVLEVRCTVYIPEGSSKKMVELLMNEGAEVVVVGTVYSETLEYAKSAVAAKKEVVMVPAYDDPVVWRGHASIIDEMKDQLLEKPDAIFCSAGGGGLLGGIILGCKEAGWDDVPIVVLETHGSNCLTHSISLNRGANKNIQELQAEVVVELYDPEYDVRYAHLKQLTSRASSLGASSPAPGVVRMALDRAGGVKCVNVSDELSMMAALRFAGDHKFLVELACSTTLTPAYVPDLFQTLQPLTGPWKTVVFIVCGGANFSLCEMVEYQKIVETAMESGVWQVSVEGSGFEFKSS